MCTQSHAIPIQVIFHFTLPVHPNRVSHCSWSLTKDRTLKWKEKLWNTFFWIQWYQSHLTEWRQLQAVALRTKNSAYQTWPKMVGFVLPFNWMTWRSNLYSISSVLIRIWFLLFTLPLHVPYSAGKIEYILRNHNAIRWSGWHSVGSLFPCDAKSYWFWSESTGFLSACTLNKQHCVHRSKERLFVHCQLACAILYICTYVLPTKFEKQNVYFIERTCGASWLSCFCSLIVILLWRNQIL